MKKKDRVSVVTVLTRRMGILIGVLWFTTMSLLTVISAQQLQRKWVEHATGMTSLQISEQNAPGQMETDHIVRMWTFDFMGQQYLNLPLYKDPAYFRKEFKQGYTAYETATVYLKDGEPVMTHGDYMTFEYLHADSWGKGQETPDGYAYVDLSKLSTERLSGEYMPAFSDGDDIFRLTGYFEENQFLLQELAGFSVEYPALYEGKNLSQWDQEKGLNWKIHYENPQWIEKEMVCIYTTGLNTYHHMANRPVARLLMKQPDELKNMLLTKQPEKSESRSLMETVIVTKRNAVSLDGTDYQVLTALRCYPLQAALWRLHPIWFASELVCVALVGFYYALLKRRLKVPLQQIIDCGQQNMLELKFPYNPKWKEPYQLEEIYTAAQQELQTLRRENTQLKTALVYAQNAETSRKQLVSDITHELKTPLAVIRSYCEGLLAGIAPEKQERYLNIVMEEADRMDAMVLEMLDLSRLEAGKVRLSQDPVELLGLTKGILEKVQPLMAAKELLVTFAVEKESPIMADEARLGQVITNLVSNAIKYSPVGGQIVIRVFQRNGLTHFSIENECAPLSQEALEKVWESFYRVDDSRTTKGTGLGLSICKAIIELHRGTCQARNTTTGVEFSFTLPL